MTDIQMKGYSLITAFAWMDETLPEEQANRIRQIMGDEMTRDVEGMDPGGWYSIRYLDAWQRALAEATGASYDKLWDLIVDVAGYTARQNLSTVMRLLLKFLTPERLVPQLPRIWTKYFKNAPMPTVQVDRDGGQATLALEGFRGLRYPQPAIAGWVIAAYDLLGVKSVQVQEVLSDPADESAENFRWEVRWDRAARKEAS